jgi:hypothetical protein
MGIEAAQVRKASSPIMKKPKITTIATPCTQPFPIMSLLRSVGDWVGVGAAVI